MKKILLISTLILIGFSNIMAQIPTDNLEANYPFNGNANDASGNGNNATVYGASLTDDRFGNPNSAYEFDGNNDYINTFTPFDLVNRTVSFWAKPTVINGTGFNSCGAVWQDYTSHNYGVILADFRDGILQLNAGGNTPYFDSTITANTWIHVSLVRGTDSTKYYLNGALVGEGLSGNLISNTSPSQNLLIGTDRTKNRRFFDGIIDDIRVYSDVLTDCEIWSLYNEETDIFDIAVSQTDTVLMANDMIATYQWMDCSADSIIAGETNQTFIATENGSYAVILNNGICTDTSDCYTVMNIGITENDFSNKLILYPNPTDGDFSIDLGKQYQTISITITDLQGKLLFSKRYKERRILDLKLEQTAGIYLLTIESGDNKKVVRLVKK